MSITDAALAQTWLSTAVTAAGATTSTDTYQGTTINVLDQVDGLEAGYAIIGDKVVVFGDLASVKAAIDSGGKSGFASEPGPKAAFASVDGDYVAFSYLALRPLLDWSTSLSDAVGAGSTQTGVAAAISDTMLKVLPDWTASWLRFESDALVIETSAPQPATPMGPSENRTSAVIEHVPGSAIFAATSNDVGATIQQGLDLIGTDAAAKAMIDQLDQALGLIGGRDAILGWIGDAGVVIDASGGTPDGGIIIAPTDQAAAKQLFTTIKSFIALGGAQQGLSVSDEDYAGTTITTVELSDLGALTGDAGAGTDLLPIPKGSIQISFAVTGDIVVIGTGPAFVKAVLDTTASSSLAADPAYKGPADQAGPSTNTAFVDISGIRGLIEQAIADGDPSALTDYETNVKPFLAPLDTLFASGSVDGDLTRSEVTITVK